VFCKLVVLNIVGMGND